MLHEQSASQVEKKAVYLNETFIKSKKFAYLTPRRRLVPVRYVSV